VSDGVACGVVGVVSAIAPRGARSVRGAGGTGTALRGGTVRGPYDGEEEEGGLGA
jgi:hypothetical protein